MTQESLQGNLEVSLRSQPSQVHNLIYVVCTEISLRLETPGRAPEGLKHVISTQVGLHTPGWRQCMKKGIYPEFYRHQFLVDSVMDHRMDHKKLSFHTETVACFSNSLTSKNDQRYHTSHRNSSHFQAGVSKVRGAGIEGFARGWLKLCLLSYKMKEMVKECQKKTDEKKIKVSTASNFLMDKSSNTSRVN